MLSKMMIIQPPDLFTLTCFHVFVLDDCYVAKLACATFSEACSLLPC